MRKIHAAVTAGILASLAMTVSACGNAAQSAAGGTPKSTQAVDPLHGLSGGQIVSKATANTKTMPSIEISGHVRDSGQTISLDLSLEKGKGCTGTMSQSKTGSFQLISDDSTVWIMPDNKFWTTQGGTDPAVLSLLEGKYLQLKPGSQGLGSLVSLCSISTLLNNSTSKDKISGTGKVTMTTYQGQRAVRVTDPAATGAYAYVSDTAKPLLLAVALSGSNGGTLTLSYPAKPAAITAPPASKIVDGSKYGF